MAITLYSYFRSSAAFRVRIALNLKGIDYQIHSVHLLKDGGQQSHAKYLKLNPQGLVPVLVIDDMVISQSAAMIEYLEETYPEPSLLPKSVAERAYVRSLAQTVACDIHPLNNLRVLQYLKTRFNIADAKASWYPHWIEKGFDAFEHRLCEHGSNGRFCFGDTAGMADIFLIPQLYNALRFDCGLESYPLIKSIYAHCMQQTAFAKAAPENQPDAE